jgi:hypothetical protein
MVLALGLLRGCYEEMIIVEPGDWSIPERVLELDGVYAFTDMEDHLLLYTLPNDTISSFSPHVGFGDFESLEFEDRELKDNEVNDLGEMEQEKLVFIQAIPVLRSVAGPPPCMRKSPMAWSYGRTGMGRIAQHLCWE